MGEKKPAGPQIERAVSVLATLLPQGPDREQCKAELAEAVRALEEKFPSPNSPTIASLVNALYPLCKKYSDKVPDADKILPFGLLERKLGVGW